MCDCCDDYDCDFNYEIPKANKMKRNFYVEGNSYWDTLEDAVKEASQRSASKMSEYRVFQAVKLVGPTTPNVVVTDLTITPSTG